MTFTIAPIIQESKVVKLSLLFDKPLSIPSFRKLLETINTALNDQAVQKNRHQHNFTNYPVYSNGEMIAVVQKCSCGKTKRNYT